MTVALREFKPWSLCPAGVTIDLNFDPVAVIS